MSDKAANVLWIMADQLRWDYLSCYGHPHLHTPNLDRLASKGVRFNNAYVQSPFCGPSRMSSYTGRYCHSHGATWNGFPLRVGEPTLGDHLRKIGVKPVLVGKTHMTIDKEGMEWLGIDRDTEVGVRISECGFDPYERDDGLHPDTLPYGEPEYNRALREKGINNKNPWNARANAGLDEEGNRLSGWLLKYSRLPADIPEELSETPYMTRRAMEFIDSAGGDPWMLHVSYIKPHWPYIVPEPYASMYGPEHVVPAIRSDAEKDNDHPVYKAYRDSRICTTFARDEVRETVIPAYMGLIKQIDDQMGVLFQFLEDRELMDNTMIVFTSDHGDYLGDHWMGEKDLFHDQSVKVPLIIFDPRKEADPTRGTTCDELVEAIDLAPTFLEYFGGKPKPHIMEGRNLDPLLHGKETAWREYLISEYDYATREARQILGNDQKDARLIMVRDARWKYVHSEGFRPMLFDLQEDPQELVDLGDSESAELDKVRARMADAIFRWARRHHNRITVTPERVEEMSGLEPKGILIGFWDEAEYEAAYGEPFPQPT